MSNLSTTQAVQLGTAVGVTGSVLLFFFVPWYHNLVVWQWTHLWWLALPGAAIGAALAVLED